MVPARTGRAVLIFLAALAVGLTALMFAPFADALLVAAVLAGALHGWQVRLAAALRGRPSAAAGLLTAGVLIAIVVPVTYLAVQALRQVGAAIDWVRQAVESEGLVGLVRQLPDPLAGLVGRALQELPTDLAAAKTFAAEQSGRAAQVLGGVVSATGVALAKTFLFLVAFFFLLVDGPRLVAWIDEVVPLQRGQVKELAGDFRRATVAVLSSTLATALVQSAVALAGYALAGVPHAVFFGFLTFLVALVPGLGAAPVVVAMAILQFATGHRLGSLFLVAWAVPVSLIDNLMKPALLRRGLAVHPAIIFFTLLGGLTAFGALGLVIGPLILAFLLAVIRMFRRDMGS